MSFTSSKILLSIFVILLSNQQIECTENVTLEIQKETRIIPITTVLNFPSTHERIIVPANSIKKKEEILKPVREHGVESNVIRPMKRVIRITTTVAPVVTVNPRQRKRAPKHYPVEKIKGKNDDAQSFVTRSDNHRSRNDANRLQPLHIKTEIFKKTTPNNSGLFKPSKEQKEKIKIENLPANPEKVPETTWFDNVGNYNYGILHTDGYTATPEYTATSAPLKAEPRAAPPASLEQLVETIPPKNTFKSSFRDPKQIQPVIHDNKLGAFLYKTEVHYPSYRNHLYPPVITYGIPHDQPITKDLPAMNVHNSHQRKPEAPLPPRRNLPVEPEQKPDEKKQAQKDDDGDDYDEEEDSSEDYEDGAKNDKYDGKPPSNQEDKGNDKEQEKKLEEGEEDDEEGDEEAEDGESDETSPAPKYRFDFDHGKGSYEFDDFDRAWSKFGYGPKTNPKRPKKTSASDEYVDEDEDESESRSAESSETRVAPTRIKFYHEVKEESSSKSTTQAPPLHFFPIHPYPTRRPMKKMTKVVSGNINNTKLKIPQKPIAPVVIQDEEAGDKNTQRSEAGNGSDDLKYFQYFNYLGDGMHTAGGRSGNDNHYIEAHERGDKPGKKFQKKVRWADKQGGFGEHYWDLNH